MANWNSDDVRWWRDDDHFAPLLPPAVARLWRVPAYLGALALVIVGLARILPVEIHPWNTILALLAMAAIWIVVELLDPREVWAYELRDTLAIWRSTRSRRPATGETIRLGEVRHE